MNNKLTQSRLKQLLNYDQDTGVFRWRITHGRMNAGDVAGGIRAGNAGDGGGYRCIRIDRAIYYGSRLAFLYMEGSFPNNHMDHINHNRSDNRWLNLREVTRKENSKNQSIPSNNKSGVMGVSWYKRYNKYVVHINVGGRKKFIGYYETLNKAKTARKKAEAKHNYHNNHGAIPCPT